MKVTIIGAGWAGLSTAVDLAHGGADVTVLEAARQLGGRARSVPFRNYHVDNGQHILLGAYTAILRLLDRVGVEEEQVFRRLPLALSYRHLRGGRLDLRSGSLPAPLHLLQGLLSCGLLTTSEKLNAIRVFLRMRLSRFSLSPDCSLLTYLQQRRQGPRAIEWLWEPICLSALNTPLSQASAVLFMRVMRDAFFADKRHSDLLLPIADLGTCLPQPAMDYVESKGGQVQLGRRVEGLAIENGVITGVATSSGMQEAEHVVIATAPEACVQLLGGLDPLKGLSTDIAQLKSMPIATLYLQYPETTTLGEDFIGVIGGATQWIFDRGRLMNEPGLVAAVISGPGGHERLDAQTLTDNIIEEIATLYPQWARPVATKLIREKRATFAATPGVDNLRPALSTPIRGLWLAGDYTATGYPSTLEGAVRSGQQCAAHILNQAD